MRVLCLQSAPHQAPDAVDHFAGVADALAVLGLQTDRNLIGDPIPTLREDTALVAVADVLSPHTQRALRLANERRLPTLLLMDGIVELRNTTRNPRSGPRFLSPAPVHAVACCGPLDADILRALGNPHPIPTGLPRLAGVEPLRRGERLLIATARTPAFDAAERTQLLRALAELRDAADQIGAEVAWRLTARLHLELGVDPDRRPIADALADAGAVVTTTSTMMVEAMLAGRPTAILHPYPSGRWQPAGWAWSPIPESIPDPGEILDPTPDITAERERLESDGAEIALTRAGLAPMLRSLCIAEDEPMAIQHHALQRLASDPRRAAAEVAQLIATLIEQHERARDRNILPPPAEPAKLSWACAPVERKSRPRVANLYVIDGPPLGGVPVWCDRVAKAFAEHPDWGYDVRTLAVSTQRFWAQGDLLGPIVDGAPAAHGCVVHETADHVERLRVARDALEALDPDVVVVHCGDICHTAAAQLRALGVPTVAVMHCDEDAYRTALLTYDTWDAAVGVSEACCAWLRSVAGDRPVEEIPCGAPVADRPRTTPERGPLRLAYVGRFSEHQKRVGDLHRLLDELDAAGVEAELHVIGDGPDLDRWLAERERTRETRGVGSRVLVHGAKPPSRALELLASCDALVNVSEFEGASVAMLEAMGLGVVPCVTAVRSGVNEWIENGVNGFATPVGDMAVMARRLAALAADRARLRRMSEAAWHTARDRGGVVPAARATKLLLDRVLSTPARTRPGDAGLRPIEAWRWRKHWSDDPAAARSWIHERLREAGYRSIATGEPGPIDDAVILEGDVTTELAERARVWRGEGIGVAFSPTLIEPEWVRVAVAARRLVRDGAERIALFGCGSHTRRAARVFMEDLPIVGLIDDRPPAPRLFGLPVVTPGEAADRLRPDGVILSSDAWEARLWRSTEPLRAAGVPVVALYGRYADSAEAMGTATGWRAA